MREQRPRAGLGREGQGDTGDKASLIKESHIVGHHLEPCFRQSDSERGLAGPRASNQEHGVVFPHQCRSVQGDFVARALDDDFNELRFELGNEM